MIFVIQLSFLLVTFTMTNVVFYFNFKILHFQAAVKGLSINDLTLEGWRKSYGSCNMGEGGVNKECDITHFSLLIIRYH